MTDENDKQISEVAKREEAILAFWNKNNIFQKSLDKGATKGEYVFYDGPPFATGLPHYGHILASVIKDVIPRYKTMCGYTVPRVWGWDCHGLPIENIVEKELGFKHKKDIIGLGIAAFNERCRERVLTYVADWENIIPRIGRWVDMEHAYRTMDFSYMESVWWVFKQIWEKGLVYEDYRSLHICPRCETTLSQQEVAEGYKDVKDIAVTVRFELADAPGTYLLAWTTTPWTLPGNVALAVGADIDYVKVENTWNEDIGGSSYMRTAVFILSADAYARFHELFKTSKVIEKMKGSDLVGKVYKPLFEYYATDTSLTHRENGWKVYAADFVTAESGTGIVHIAPAFGEDDMALGKREHLPFIQHVGMDGIFKPEVTDFAGMEVKPRSDDEHIRLATDIAILKHVQKIGALFAKENITHAYPHCWRCDTPLLNYATSSWFVSVEKIKNNLIKNAAHIHWSPAHIKEGRFGKWLEGARDWSISRQRFWASVIPVWVCETCKKQRVFGSAAELKEASGHASIDDLHKHIVDEITVPCACGSTMKRVPDVLDTWFDSGSMPYGQMHYPFEHKKEFESAFPAQFIGEGLDQTRAWFYYLHVLSGALFQTHAFNNVIVNGIVLAEDGKKMSKKLNNYPDPMGIVKTYGADALRMYLLSSPVVQGENLSFSEKGVDEIVKKNINRLHNVLAFYQIYASDIPRDWKSANVLDRWILARLAALIAETTEGYESYRLDMAVRPLTLFIDDLSVWYVRRSRDRLRAADLVASSASSREYADSSTVSPSTSSETASSRPVSEATGSATTDGHDALATLRYVLHTLSRVIAPAMPFYAEYLFQAVREEEDEESVHLAEWPAVPSFDFDREEVLTYMFSARALVSRVLELRDKAKIKIRQPLASLMIPADMGIPQEYLMLVLEETNVKRIEIGDTFTLDTTISEELRTEGFIRELKRALQAARRDAHLHPNDIADTAILIVSTTDARVVRDYLIMLTNVARVRDFVIQTDDTVTSGQFRVRIE
jgi:isoleucyl-tRNA synthetase